MTGTLPKNTTHLFLMLDSTPGIPKLSLEEEQLKLQGAQHMITVLHQTVVYYYIYKTVF